VTTAKLLLIWLILAVIASVGVFVLDDGFGKLKARNSWVLVTGVVTNVVPVPSNSRSSHSVAYVYNGKSYVIGLGGAEGYVVGAPETVVVDPKQPQSAIKYEGGAEATNAIVMAILAGLLGPIFPMAKIVWSWNKDSRGSYVA
jgi:hypothetical protein